MRRTVYFIGLCLVLTMGLYGCGSSTTADSVQTAAQAKSAKATFSVTIPVKATKSLIPSGTSYVYVSWYGYDPATQSYAPGELYLYPDASGKATGTADLIPGIYQFTATCYNSSNVSLATAGSMASVSSGSNNIVISFISGRWTFASPIVLSGGESIASLDIAPATNAVYGDYPVTWNVTTNAGSQALSGYMTYMSISGDLSYLAQQFGFPTLGAGSQFDMISFDYNITQGGLAGSGNWAQGDRVVAATSMGPGEGSGSSTPDIYSYFNTKFTSGTSLSGTLLEFTYGTSSSTPVATPTGMCVMQQPYKKASFRNVALQSALGSRASKSATSIGSVTLTYKSCEYAPVGGETFTDTNGNGYYDYAEFYDANGNGVYDAGIDSPYSDSNGNGVYDPAEPFVDANMNGYYDYGTSAYTEVTVTETLNNLIVYPFTATGQ